VDGYDENGDDFSWLGYFEFSVTVHDFLESVVACIDNEMPFELFLSPCGTLIM
jgi:hypothetical protein